MCVKEKELSAGDLTLDDIRTFREDFVEELCELCQDFEALTGTSIDLIDLIREHDEEESLHSIIGVDVDLLLDL